jgi:hypothetical protein
MQFDANLSLQYGQIATGNLELKDGVFCGEATIEQ